MLPFAEILTNVAGNAFFPSSSLRQEKVQRFQNQSQGTHDDKFTALLFANSLLSTIIARRCRVASAHAVTPPPSPTASRPSLAAQGVEIGWTDVTGDGTQIVLEGVTVGRPASRRRPTRQRHARRRHRSQWRLSRSARVTHSTTIRRTEEGMTIDVAGASITGLTLPAEGSTDPLASMMMYESAELATVSVKKGDKTAVLAGRAACRASPRRPTASRWSLPAPPKSSPPT